MAKRRGGIEGGNLHEAYSNGAIESVAASAWRNESNKHGVWHGDIRRDVAARMATSASRQRNIKRKANLKHGGMAAAAAWQKAAA